MKHIILASISLALCIISIFKAKKTGTAKINRIFYSSTILLLILLTGFFVVSDYFTAKGIDESVIYHLKYGLSGAGFSEYQLIISISVAFIIVAFYLSYVIYRQTGKTCNSQKRKSNILASYLFISAAFIFHPATSDIFELSKADTSHNFSKYYKAPQITKKTELKRNLVFIYAESLERTYFDETIFPGLINGLRDLESKSTYFTDISDVVYGNWTVAGLTTSQCGIPLSILDNENSMGGMDSFLIGAQCLGDLLREEGYLLSYLGGASLNFAGKGKFFSTHGFDNVSGLEELESFLPDKSYTNGWGLYDDTLFDIALEQFYKLSESGNPFGLFLLTIDTHQPKGHPSRSCDGIPYRDGSNSMLNAVACSDYLISRFVKAILQSPYFENTEIVISSDHLSLRNTAFDLLQKGDRKNLFMAINSKNKESKEITKKGTTLDIGPTVLHLLGYEGEIGLGRNLLGNDIPLISQVENINETLIGWESSLLSFWDFPTVKNNIMIDAINRKIKIDDRTFELPILIKFNEKLETTLHFQWTSWMKDEVGVIRQFMMMDKDTPFLWVDTCASINQRIEKRSICVKAGKKGSKLLMYGRVANTMDITVGQLKELVELKIK